MLILALVVLLTGAEIAYSPLLVIYVFVGVVAFCGIGSMLGSYTDSRDGAVTASNAIGLPLLFLSETFISLEQLPGKAVFEAAEAVGVVSEDERAMALIRAAEPLSVSADALEAGLYADLEDRQRLTAVETRWDPDDLLAQYNLSLAQTALFDATELRVRSSDPKALVSAIKRLRLMYEIHAPGKM